MSERGYERFSRVWRIIDPTSAAPDIRWGQIAKNTVKPVGTFVSSRVADAVSRVRDLASQSTRQERERSVQTRELGYQTVHRDTSFGFGWVERAPKDDPYVAELRKLRRV